MIPRFALLGCLALVLLPDEGQWLPTQIRDWDWTDLQRRGMQLGKDEFWHPERGGVLSAAVQINGCTASFVSAEGLLLTNHHCGFGAISALSTLQTNHLQDGFVAADRQSELPAPGMVALVLKRIEDVTSTVHAAQAAATSDLDRWQRTQDTIAALVRDGEAREPGTVCSVASYLEGKEYHLHFRTRLTDVRLVYAPPRAIGEFGGEVDNWEWPRHTGDFCFFRAYAAPDGSPRDHTPDNVPFRPQHFLRMAKGGVRAGDLAIVMGYPGNTQRYKTSRAVATRQDYVYPKRDELLTAVLDVLQRAAAGSPAMALQLASRIKTLANVQKNAKGMIFGLARNGVVARKLLEEEQLQHWIAADPQRAQRYSDVLEQMLALDDAEAAWIARDLAIGFAGGLLADAPLLAALVEGCQAAAAGEVPARLMQSLASPRLTADLDAVQLPVLAIVLGEFRSLPPDQQLQGTEALPPKPDAHAMVRELLAGSRMLDPAARIALFAEGRAAVAASEDPLVVLARGLAAERDAYTERTRERQGRMLVVGRTWIEAQEAFRGRSFYPDANSTLRVSIASVKGYEPRDGVLYLPHTTLAGLLHKETGKEPFASPAALLAAAQRRRDSRWHDATLRDVPVCFLIDGDTTGGNSGSPVVNGRGELIGLNFDRVFEAVAGDFGWHPDRSRNICVDARFLAWVIEEVLPAPVLLRELGI